MSTQRYKQMYRPVTGLLLVLSGMAFASNTSVPEGQSRYQASSVADRIVLLPATHAASSQAVGWRSSIAQSQLQWAKAIDGPALELDAKTLDVKGTLVQTDNGPAYFYKATMPGLQSDTLYAYRVKGEGNWSEWLQFRTAKPEFEPFSLLYFGDAQNNLKAHFSRLVRSAQQQVPQAKLVLHAGDLVNSRYGILDHEWGEWFDAIGWVGAMTPQLIAAGNHEYLKSTNAKGEERRVLAAQFTAQFQSLNNGPASLQDTVFYHDYQGVRFVVLNSTAAVEDEALAKVQADWLKQVLSNNPNRWTIAIYHHPMFSVSLGRDNPRLRQYWQPLFEQYKVDLVLQGHDHVYGRYQPENKGPVYMVSVAGPKMYLVSKQARANMAQVGEDTQLFQHLEISESQLTVKAITVTGRLYDSFSLQRQSNGSNLLQQHFKAKVAHCSNKTIADNKCWQGTEFSAAQSASENQ
ncbi:metallophosphoesterase family protein [Rheinheimera mesophila]|uniref:Metallophosphoesterase family protein n=1 Tax=Rheinheimera mesophila TaxID=1547515 RepID=A0A3P3QE48_9GAMM|nr:metallophosphoesterase family protein [Rheinheimera mesophila]RRJ19462.1 metallophosphoesterase family protein [Rheinheimera mesophila]